VSSSCLRSDPETDAFHHLLSPEQPAMNFKPPSLRCFSMVGLSLALAACDTPPTLVDQQFGLAVKRAQAHQSLLVLGAPPPVPGHCPSDRPNPHCPPPHLRPRDGMSHGMGAGHAMGTGAAPHHAHSGHDRLHAVPDTDGASALAAVTRYQQSFQTPPAPVPVFNIGLGALSAP